MGGTPRYAQAVLAVPAGLDPAVTSEILRGGADLAHGDGVSITGGHTVTAPEPLYGLAVTGTVLEADLWTNAGGRAGDLLCLSKPLGSGVIANALRKDAADATVVRGAVDVMVTTNRAAADTLRACRPHAVVDVTGFGLVGHLRLLAQASGCAAEIDLDALPAIAGALELIAAGTVPGGSQRNRDAADAYMTVADDADPLRVILACDAQTSGGLLAAVAPDTDLSALPGPIVGRLVEGAAGAIAVA